MKSKTTVILLLLSVFIGSEFVLTGCKSYCPAIDGTGNTASRGVRRTFGRTDCPGVNSTGNYKPKVKNKREDGLMSAKMARQVEKANNKKAGPIESKKLHFD